MIWATVSSRSCYCWLYRASLSLAAKNITNLISVLTIWWCPCVESSLVLLEEGVCYVLCAFSWQNSISLCPASFCTPKPDLPVFPGISWLPAFTFQSPIMKRTYFFLSKIHGKIHGVSSWSKPSSFIGAQNQLYDILATSCFLRILLECWFCSLV